MDLTSYYLGMKLRSPLVAAASPLSMTLDSLRSMEEHGAAAVVLASLFAEQIEDAGAADANGAPPPWGPATVDPEQYLDYIGAAKAAVGIPVIASLNACSPGGWSRYAKRIEAAGADALELNLYSVAADIGRSGRRVDDDYLTAFKAVRSEVTIPLAVKLGPYFSSVAHMARQFELAGAQGLVLFNRFYQADFDLSSRTVKPRLSLSEPHESRLPLTWIALLFGRIKVDLAATTGIHTATEIIKMVMAGASVTMMASILLKLGPRYLSQLERSLVYWLENNGVAALEEIRGSMAQLNCVSPDAYIRAQYIETIKGFSAENSLVGGGRREP